MTRFLDNFIASVTPINNKAGTGTQVVSKVQRYELKETKSRHTASLLAVLRDHSLLLRQRAIVRFILMLAF